MRGRHQQVTTTERSTDELRRIAEEGAAELENATAIEILQWVDRTFGPDGWVVSSSMQDAVMVDLASRVRDDVNVMFIDTGYHFPETIGTRDAVATVYPNIRLINATADTTVAQQDSIEGKDLFARDPNRCCQLRKVIPMRRTLSQFDAWISGLRRAEASTRAHAPAVSFNEKFGVVKVNPIVTWTDEDTERYIEQNGILVNPLIEDGYPSIGCRPCTSKPLPGADPRSGRWAGTGKVECGLHS